MLKRNLGLLGALAIACVSLAAPAYAVDTSLDGNLRGNCGTVTASSGAATLANKCGVVTSESLTTLKDSEYTLTLTNSAIAAADVVLATVANGTNSGGEPSITRVTPGAGSLVIVVKNLLTGAVGTGASFNGTIKINYFNIKP
jgi:hypothetical protein